MIKDQLSNFICLADFDLILVDLLGKFFVFESFNCTLCFNLTSLILAKTLYFTLCICNFFGTLCVTVVVRLTAIFPQAALNSMSFTLLP